MIIIIIIITIIIICIVFVPTARVVSGSTQRESPRYSRRKCDYSLMHANLPPFCYVLG